MASVSNARKLATWHATVPLSDVLTIMTMDMLLQIGLTKYCLQVHQHAAGTTPLVGMTDQPLGIMATPGAPTIIIGTDTDSVALKDKNCYMQRNGKFLVYTNSDDHTATIGTVKSTLRIPPRHNGVIPIKISGPIIERNMAYFLTDDSTPKGKDPNINIIDAIHKIKGRTSVNILVSNYTNYTMSC